MGILICMFSSSSRASTSAGTIDSSTSLPQAGQHISIQTFRELNPAPTSSPISTRTEIPLNGGNSRSTADLQGEDNNQPMTLTRQHLTQEVRQRLLEFLKN
ncbi:AC4 [Bhendi yellow vein mosaic virus [2005:Pandaralli:India]]|uniref:AC4 n=1 Tax=Bhendi yellow vein mosaic virus TaxID=120168 RepID=A0A2K9RFB8_9GEMI|nr:AC4 [Bhendi yellow vein mosaic virus [2005:Pandaralli:India]]AUT36491.1 AC4 [Bhendi yellow vein mosaic virus]